MGKRDRWASSSEDEDDGKKKSRKRRQEQEQEQQQQQQQQQQHQKSCVTAAAATTVTLHNPLLQGCRSVYDTYEKLSRVSEGTYGIVWKARDLVTHEIVALKQIKFDAIRTGGDTHSNSHGFPLAALREINVLLALSSSHHDSIVSVREMVVGHGFDKVFMVMDFFDLDLKTGLERRFQGDNHQHDAPLTQGHLKGILQQILRGVAHIHEAWYLHRDLKPSNILIRCRSSGSGSGDDNDNDNDNDMVPRIALADFGLARQYSDPQRQALTPLVVTLWYRAPELLFGENRYGPPIDMWSVGCIFGELIRQDAILQGEGELDQMDQIFSLLGVPDQESWPSFDQLPNARLFRWKRQHKRDLLLPKLFPVASPVAIVSPNQAFLDSNGYHLLQRLLTLDPARRITAQQALDHPYFQQGVPPKLPRFFLHP